jgi:hypothetical protein
MQHWDRLIIPNLAKWPVANVSKPHCSPELVGMDKASLVYTAYTPPGTIAAVSSEQTMDFCHAFRCVALRPQ